MPYLQQEHLGSGQNHLYLVRLLHRLVIVRGRVLDLPVKFEYRDLSSNVECRLRHHGCLFKRRGRVQRWLGQKGGDDSDSGVEVPRLC